MTTTAATHDKGWTASDATFGARLALVRQRMAWGSVAEAARACGQPVESWRTWERDGVEPRRMVTIAKQISSTVGCDYLWLLLGPDRGENGGGGTESNILARMPRLPLAPRIVTTAGQPHPGHSRPVRRTRPARSTHHAVTAAAA